MHFHFSERKFMNFRKLHVKIQKCWNEAGLFNGKCDTDELQIVGGITLAHWTKFMSSTPGRVAIK